MLRSFDFCLPTRSTTVPDGEDGLHEVKYDGYRLRVERDGDRMRLITRGGKDYCGCRYWFSGFGRLGRIASRGRSSEKPKKQIEAKW
jgi:hypothetical protein